jgi:hypothetical protein
MLDFTK